MKASHKGPIKQGGGKVFFGEERVMIDEYMMCGNVGKRIFGDNPLEDGGGVCV